MTKKTAVITGASRGIGREIAKKMASEGWNLFLTCRQSEQELNIFSNSLQNDYGVEIVSGRCDVSSYKEVTDFFSKITSLDVLINNAGISHIGLLQDMSCEEWHRILDTNLSSLFYTCKRAVPLMLPRQNGHIINISSVWGSVGGSMEVAYSASKGGVDSFTKALGKELAPSGIRVNALACGFIDTDMNACFTEEEKEELVSEIPANRAGTPKEVAEAVYALIGMPDYITGQILSIDGGWI